MLALDYAKRPLADDSTADTWCVDTTAFELTLTPPHDASWLGKAESVWLCAVCVVPVQDRLKEMGVLK